MASPNTTEEKIVQGVKIASTVLIFFSAFCGVLTPRLFNPFGNKMTYGNLLAAGVLISGGFVHLLSDASNSLEHSPLPKAAFNQPYPWAYFICALTLLGLFLFERILVHHCLANKHNNTNDNNNKSIQSSLTTSSQRKPIMRSHKNHHHGVPEQHTADTMELLQEKHYFSSIMLLLGLGLHSFLAGLALGASYKEKTVIVLTIGILSHKYLASFALGCSIYKSYIGKSLIFSVGIAIFFSILTPSGIIVGWAIHFNGNTQWIPDIFISIASGTFLYVAIFEIVVPEFSEESAIERKIYNTMSMSSINVNNNKDNKKNDVETIDPDCTKKQYDYADILKMSCLMVGFGIMSMLAIWV